MSGKVLDIGCGYKPYQGFFKKAEYLGLDLPGSDSLADLRGDALHIPLPNSSLDASFSSWLLDDLSEPGAYFAELNRVLKPGGLAIMAETRSFPEHDAPHDYFRPTKYGLKYLAEKNGFQEEEILPLGGFWAQIGSHLSAFFLRGSAGHLGNWVRVFNLLVNPFFYLLDKINFLDRGTPAYFAVFRKK